MFREGSELDCTASILIFIPAQPAKPTRVDLFSHYLQIVILGIVEGVTEFLPISSTGHLLIAEHLLDTKEPEVFNVVIQAGAILAVVFVYWEKIMTLLGHLDKPEAQQYVLKIFGAFFVTGVVGLVMKKGFHFDLPETLYPVAWATLIGGLVILVIEFLSKNLYPHDDVSWPEAILMGLAQVLAGIFPGTSRSGSTIMTGLIMGMKRPMATEFSFLVGIPTMFAASALDLWSARKDLTTGDHQLIIDIALGFVISGIVAFFVIKWLLHFVQSHTFNGFAIYRIILGLVLLAALATGNIADIGKGEEHAPNAVSAHGKLPETPVPAAASTQVVTPTPTPTPTPPPAATPIPTPEAATPTPTPPRALPVDPSELNNAAISHPIDNSHQTESMQNSINQPVFNHPKKHHTDGSQPTTNQTDTPMPPASNTMP
jgi:undecaprenyl-diphosphatase